MAFEMFTHVTSFAGLKVVLLGRYNGQGLDHEPEADLVSYARSTPSSQAWGVGVREGSWVHEVGGAHALRNAPQPVGRS